MRHQIRIFAIAAALALCIGMAAPAQAWPGGGHGATPAAGWLQAAVDTLATLFGLDRPVASLKGSKRGDASAFPAPQPTPQADGSACIDPGGNPVCPTPRPMLQSDGSACIDPAGNTVCHPGS